MRKKVPNSTGESLFFLSSSRFPLSNTELAGVSCLGFVPARQVPLAALVFAAFALGEARRCHFVRFRRLLIVSLFLLVTFALNRGLLFFVVDWPAGPLTGRL